jgi:DNA-binding phage protein
MPPQRKSKPRGPDYAALGRAIEVLIAANPDISRESVAAESGLNISQVNALISGQGNPTFRNLLRLCNGLHVEIDELMVRARELRVRRPGDPAA